MGGPGGTNPDIGSSASLGSVGGMSTGGAAGLVAAPLLQVGAQLYDTYQSNKTARYNTDMTIAAQKEMADLAYQRQIAMWNRQNRYNSPAAQMQRFIEAGLNPHLIYGQGNSGNASQMPQYQPPSIQYRYAAPTYGAAVESLLPTLMSVGTWLQNMRLGEAEIKKKETDTERVEQLIAYLLEMNPKLLEEKSNKLSLFPYQKSMTESARYMAENKLHEFESEFRYKYGDELAKHLWRSPGSDSLDKALAGARGQALLQQFAKTKLDEAKASWTEFDITNPQAIMQMVLGGVMGLAGQSLRLSTGKINPKSRTAPKTVKTFYNEKGRRRSQVVNFED